MDKYKEIVVESYNPLGSFRNVNPFTLAFCRTVKHGNILLKGGLNAVNHYIESELKEMALVSFRLFHHGRSRGYTHMVNSSKYLFIRDHDKAYNFIGYKLYDIRNNIEIAHYRKVPSTFPRILEQFVQ